MSQLDLFGNELVEQVKPIRVVPREGCDSVLMLGDCLERMLEIEADSADLVLCDPPYGTTACKWDTIIPFEPMWRNLKRIAKKNAAIVMTASQPFTTALAASNMKAFKYELIWEKTTAVDFAMAKKRPRKKHENILVFCEGTHLYNPQMEPGKPYTDKPRKRSNKIYGSSMPKLGIENKGFRYPSSVQKFSSGNNGNVHPTQKPVALMEYLIQTYTNEGDTVLDFTFGSGTTGVAAANLGRKFIGIEMDADYFEIGRKRILDACGIVTIG